MSVRTKVKGPTSARKSDEGYKGHRPGSRKGDIHRIFDEQGPDAAHKAATRKKLKPATVRTWISSWPKPRNKRA